MSTTKEQKRRDSNPESLRPRTNKIDHELPHPFHSIFFLFLRWGGRMLGELGLELDLHIKHFFFFFFFFFFFPFFFPLLIAVEVSRLGVE